MEWSSTSRVYQPFVEKIGHIWFSLCDLWALHFCWVRDIVIITVQCRALQNWLYALYISSFFLLNGTPDVCPYLCFQYYCYFQMFLENVKLLFLWNVFLLSICSAKGDDGSCALAKNYNTALEGHIKFWSISVPLFIHTQKCFIYSLYCQ